MKTFIIRDYPDLDHIFPIINIFLKNDKKVNVLNFEINMNIREDLRIKYLLQNYKEKLNLIDIYTLKGNRIIQDNILNFLAADKYKKINFKNIKNLKKKNNFFRYSYFFLICFLKKIIFNANSLFENIFFTENWSRNIIKKLSVTSIIMDDSYYFNYKRPKSLIEFCKKNKIKITLVPHTCYMFSRVEDINNLKSKNLKNLYPNVIVTSERMKKIFNQCGADNQKVFNLGSARFCKENTNLLDQIYGKNNILNETKNNKLNILYIDGAFDIRKNKIELIHEISKLNNINFKVKAHPRGLFQIDKVNENGKQFKKSNYTNFFLDISTPTKKLIEESDIVIGTYSSALIDAIILNKKILFPKFLLKIESKFEIFHESFNFVSTFLNLDDMTKLLAKLDKVTLQNLNTTNDAELFLSQYVYGGKKIGEQILENYFNFLTEN